MKAYAKVNLLLKVINKKEFLIVKLRSSVVTDCLTNSSLWKLVDIKGDVVKVPITNSKSISEIKEEIILLLKQGGSYKMRDIKEKLQLNIPEKELKKILSESSSFLKTKKGSTTLYSIFNPSMLLF